MLKGMGRAINKTVTVAEIVKRRVVGLHQDTEISSLEITDTWEPREEGRAEGRGGKGRWGDGHYLHYAYLYFIVIAVATSTLSLRFFLLLRLRLRLPHFIASNVLKSVGG